MLHWQLPPSFGQIWLLAVHLQFGLLAGQVALRLRQHWAAGMHLPLHSYWPARKDRSHALQT